MRLILFLILPVFFLSEINGQNGSPQNAGGRGAAMGNASLTFDDINAAYSNQAGLAFLDGFAVSAYGENRFLTEGLNSFLFAAAMPISKIGTFGLSVNYFGFKDYNEQKIGLSYSRKLAKNFSLGLQLDYLGTRIPEYGAAHSITAELGLLAKINKNFSIAAHVYNPIHSKVGAQDFLPTIIGLGVAYSPSEKVTLTGQLEKDIFGFPLVGRVGLEYKPIKVLSLRGGIVASQIATFSFGLGVNLQSLKIDFATTYHQVLGFTPALSLSYSILKKTEKK